MLLLQKLKVWFDSSSRAHCSLLSAKKLPHESNLSAPVSTHERCIQRISRSWGWTFLSPCLNVMPFTGPKAEENKTSALRTGLASSWASSVLSPAVHQMGQKSYSGSLFQIEHRRGGFKLTEGPYCMPSRHRGTLTAQWLSFSVGLISEWKDFHLPTFSHNATIRQNAIVFFIVCTLLQHKNDFYLQNCCILMGIFTKTSR